LVIDGTNTSGIALSASEFTNVTGFETFRFINNTRAADNSRTGTNSYSLTLNDATVTQNAAANILNIVNDNGVNNGTDTVAGVAVLANGGITIDVRTLSAGKNINYDGQETHSNGTWGSVSSTTGTATYTAAVANSQATAMTADRFIFSDANINATAVIDGGADVTGGSNGVAGTTRFGHIANTDVLEVRNSAVVSLGDLAGIRNVGTIEFTNDTAAVQTSVLQLSDATVDTLVNSTFATVSTNTTTIAASFEVLTVTALDNAIVTNASTQLNLDGSLIVNAGNILNVTGGGGRDTIVGGAGADTITGGTGADDITGGSGADTLIYATTHSGVITGAATTLAGAGIDTVTIGSTDILSFGNTITAVRHSGAAQAVAVGTAGTATTGTTLANAIAAAITEANTEAFLIAVTDSGTGATFTGTFLVATYDTTFSDNDILIKLVGTNVSADDTLAIASGNVVYTIV